ncbi:MAG: PilZ domain-containing protein [Elusimicrobiota bacterium]
MRRAPGLLPVLLCFEPEAARQDAWGRLLKLTSGGAELSTAARLLKGETLLLSFELGGEQLEAVRARVEHAEDDADGHRLAELRFLDEVQRRSLAKVLTGLFARS